LFHEDEELFVFLKVCAEYEKETKIFGYNNGWMRGDLQFRMFEKFKSKGKQPTILEIRNTPSTRKK
jgi:hypothetical protein